MKVTPRERGHLAYHATPERARCVETVLPAYLAMDPPEKGDKHLEFACQKVDSNIGKHITLTTKEAEMVVLMCLYVARSEDTKRAVAEDAAELGTSMLWYLAADRPHA